jgi:hypothetical protein
MACGHQFRGKLYLDCSIVWAAYTEEKQTIRDLSLRYKVSESTIKRLLRNVSVDWKDPKSEGHGVVNLDATYFGRNCGVIAALDSNTGKPLYMKHISHEHVSDYEDAVHEIEKNGYALDGMVIDGMHTLFKVFAGYKIQMCQYHMCAIVRRKITKNPKLPAGQELQQLMRTLKDAREDDFRREFQNWKDKWKSFLNERTQNPLTEKTYYTHQRTRSAMLSIQFYLPYLFTYQHVDGMPNTNNKIEGTFTDLKKNLNNHSGLTAENRKRFINGFFRTLAESLSMKKQEPRQ